MMRNHPPTSADSVVLTVVAEALKAHLLRQPDGDRDFRCECGWTSEQPVSQHPRHVAEKLESNPLIQAARVEAAASHFITR